MTTLKPERIRRILMIGLTLAGAIGGLLYWKFVGCTTGTCPIWSNPWISTGYGALLGWLIAGLIPVGRKGNKERGNPGEPTPDDGLSKEV